MGGIVLYLVDSTGCLLPAGAAARLHHVADVLSGGQQLGHVHGGLRLQGVSLRLVGPRHAVHPYLTIHTAHVWNQGFAVSKIAPIISTGSDSPLITFWCLITRACLGSVRPPEWLNGDVQPFDQHPAPTLVLRWQSCVHVVQLLLQRLTQKRKKKKRHLTWTLTFKWTLNETSYTQQHTDTVMFMSNLLTHCSLDRDFFSTGSPSEPPGRSLSISSTYSDTGFDALAQSKGSKKKYTYTLQNSNNIFIYSFTLQTWLSNWGR